MSLFRKILLPALGVSLLGLAVAVPLLVRTADRMEQTATLTQGDAASIEVMRGLDIIISQVIHQAQLLTESPLAAHLLAAGPEDAAYELLESQSGPLLRYRDKLAGATQALQAVDILSLISPSGRIVCSSNPAAEGTRRGDRLYFQSAMKGEIAAEGPLTGRSSGKPVFALAVPVKSKEGRVLGVLLAALNLDYLNKALVEPVQLSRKGNIYVLSPTGQVILHPLRGDVLNTGWFTSAQIAEMRANGSGVLVRTTSTDDTFTSAYVTLPYPGWIVVFEGSKGNLPRIPLLRNIGLLGSFLPLLVLLGIVLPLLCSLRRDLRRTTQSIAAYTSSAEKLGTQNAQTRADETPPNDLTPTDSASPDAMLTRIAQRRDELGALGRTLLELFRDMESTRDEAMRQKGMAEEMRERVETLVKCMDDLGGGVAAIRLDDECSILWASHGFYRLHGFLPGSPLPGKPEPDLPAGNAPLQNAAAPNVPEANAAAPNAALLNPPAADASGSNTLGSNIFGANTSGADTSGADASRLQPSRLDTSWPDDAAAITTFSRAPLRAIHPEDIAHLEDILTTATRKNVPVTACYRMRQKDGSFIPLCLSGRPGGVNAGYPVFMAVFFKGSLNSSHENVLPFAETPAPGAFS